MSDQGYVIIEADNTQLLQDMIRRHKAEGWTCSGGPFTYGWAPGHGALVAGPPTNQQFDGWIFLTFCQAMEHDGAK